MAPPTPSWTRLIRFIAKEDGKVRPFSVLELEPPLTTARPTS